MNINSNTNFGINNLYNTLFQGNMALHTSRLNRNLFPLPGNNAQGPGTLDSAGVRFVNNIRAASDSISSVLRELSNASSSSRIVAMSSNPGVVSIQHTGSRPSGVSSMNVRIDQIATGQANEGARMNAEAAFEGSRGANQFSIEMGGRTTRISVDVREGDTNQEVQQRMADAINRSGAGVRATVQVDSETNTSMLRLESTTTGSNPRNSFTVTDNTGDLVARTGANDMAREGQDAIFRVNNGPQRTSQSNTVFIGNGVTATFNSASEQAATITWGRDSNVTRSSVENLVRSYNDLFSAAAERTQDPRAQNLASRMLSITGTFANSLSSIGIGIDTSGRMTINSERMDRAAESGRLDQFFTENRGRNFGFTNQLDRLAGSVSRNTANFISSSSFGSGLSENFSYSSFGDLIQYDYLGAGSLFDFLF